MFVHPYKRFLMIGLVLTVIAFIGFFIWRGWKTTDEEQELTAQLNVTPIAGRVDPTAHQINLHVATIVGSANVNTDGTFLVDGLDGGEELAMVMGDNGRPLYYGLITPGEENVIGSKSTATILLFFATGGVFISPEAWPRLLDQIDAFVATDTLSQELQSMANEHADYLVRGDGSLEPLVSAAVRRLYASKISISPFSIPVASAKEFAIDSEPKSGIRVDRGSLNNEIFLTNQFRRIVRAMIYEIGYRESGEDIFYDQQVFKETGDGRTRLSRTPEKIVDIPTITKVSDLQGTIVDLLFGKTAYGEVKSEPILLEPDHLEADATYYHIMTLGWGLRGVTPVELYDRGGYEGGELTIEEGQALAEITVTTFVQEVILPVFMLGLSSNRAKDLMGDINNDVANDIAKWFLNDPRADGEGAGAIIDALEKGQLKQAILNTGEFILKSASLRGVVANALYKKIHGKLGNIGQAFLEEFSASAGRVLSGVDVGLKMIDGSILLTNFELASQASDFIIAVVPAEIHITSTSKTKGLRIGGNYAMDVVAPSVDEGTTLHYQWSHEQKDYGHFSYGQWPDDVHEDDAFGSTSSTAVYWKDVENGGDTITVKVYAYRDVGDKVEKVFLGSDSVDLVDDERGTCGFGDWELPVGTKVVRGSFAKPYASRFFTLKQGELINTKKINNPDATQFQVILGYKEGFVKGVKLLQDASWGKDNEVLVSERDNYLFIVDKNFAFDEQELPGSELNDAGGLVWSGTNRSVSDDISVEILRVENGSQQPYTMWYDCWPYWVNDPETGEFLGR